MNLTEFGKQVRQKRQREGLTQAELAGKLNCSRSHVANLERGAFTPSLALWLKVQEFLKG